MNESTDFVFGWFMYPQNGLIAAQCWVTETWIMLQGVSY